MRDPEHTRPPVARCPLLPHRPPLHPSLHHRYSKRPLPRHRRRLDETAHSKRDHLARPLDLAAYGEPDLAELAAAYAFGLARNHAFVDGNKRAAFLALGVFLRLNGYRLTASQLDATHTMLALAAGELDEANLAAWIRKHMRPGDPSK
ncbi:MAG: type II toxin-antitoxin system death-on-curing family toxin [Casimicrobiaceae bacterium]|nr:type II toxin-antitoxin system death-on-curing family toxin [Casimicrobiaceae bacterium]